MEWQRVLGGISGAMSVGKDFFVLQFLASIFLSWSSNVPGIYLIICLKIFFNLNYML